MMSPGNQPGIDHMKTLIQLGLFQHLDGAAINPYVVDWPKPFRSRMPEADFIDFVDAIIHCFAEANLTDYPIFVTEFGWAVPVHVSEEQRSCYSARAALLLATRPTVQVANFFSLGGGGYFSFLNRDETPR